MGPGNIGKTPSASQQNISLCEKEKKDLLPQTDNPQGPNPSQAHRGTLHLFSSLPEGWRLAVAAT
jgi:hypothetical protein